MDLATISLIALVIVIVMSCTTAVNPGVLAILLAGIIGLYLAPWWGKSFSVRDVMAGFPAELFLTLVGVTLLFAQAQANGTLDQVARAAERCCRGNAGLIPIMFFVLAAVFASIGPGNIAASALIAPMAMSAARRTGIPTFLMTIMVAHGAIAGALSPLAPTGIIAGNRLSEQHLSGFEIAIYLDNLLANVLVASAGYMLFGGWRLFFKKASGSSAARAESADEPLPPMQRRHWITLMVIGVLVVSVIVTRVLVALKVNVIELDIGLGAFAAAVFLTLTRLGDEREAIRRIPWGVLLMVCGVTVLTALLEKTGGITLFARLISAVSTPETATGVLALVTGLVSVYSSTSGVVLPAFLPMVPELVSALGGDPLRFASAIIVGGHLVDSSPLSTIGALCVACAPPTEDRRVLFLQVLFWGLSMSLVGAVGCYLFFGLL